MCEILLIRSSSGSPFKLSWALSLARSVEYWGIAGFGWGVAWWDAGQERVSVYKREIALSQDDQAELILSDTSTPCALIHLRRPTLLSTVSNSDTQPFLNEQHGFAFAHNGVFSNKYKQYQSILPQFRKQSGRADSIIGALLIADYLPNLSLPQALLKTHAALRGPSNIALIGPDCTAIIYAANRGNRLYRFSFQGCDIISTELHSPDDTLFRMVFPEAHFISKLPLRHLEVLSN